MRGRNFGECVRVFGGFVVSFWPKTSALLGKGTSVQSKFGAVELMQPLGSSGSTLWSRSGVSFSSKTGWSRRKESWWLGVGRLACVLRAS